MGSNNETNDQAACCRISSGHNIFDQCCFEVVLIRGDQVDGPGQGCSDAAHLAEFFNDGSRVFTDGLKATPEADIEIDIRNPFFKDAFHGSDRRYSLENEYGCLGDELGTYQGDRVVMSHGCLLPDSLKEFLLVTPIK